MSGYELGNLETACRADRLLRDSEQTDLNVLSSVVARSRLHSIIHNPVTQGTDEG